ncbi:HupE/UreJ family protein [Albirhodobacter sp. R86504]|uniref:HupE/UreJ family protein n=1 Tax=Albirhodobacter sp. R86504 TaxID=3093848 RepID=UPI00366A5B4D
MMNVNAILRRMESFLAACLVLCLLTYPAAAHQTEPAVITVSVEAEQVEISVRDALEPILAISVVNPRSAVDADAVNALYATLRAKSPAELEAAVRADWAAIADKLKIYAGDTRLDLTLGAIAVPEVGDPQQLRISSFTLTAPLPADDTPVVFSWRADFGPVSLQQTDSADESFTELLQGGQVSQPMQRTGPTREPAAKLFARFVVSGFEHIVPKGMDHILFVLGLFLFSLRLKPILAQVTAFTLAHSITLALASLKIVTLPASVVEPLIAISIVYVAVENIVFGQRGTVSPARIAVVFAFGLLHGLGFASVLSDVGLPSGQFVIGLLGFNVGVELGQLFVILIAACVLGLPFGNKPLYRRFIVIPCSTVIALVGLWWAIERVFL